MRRVRLLLLVKTAQMPVSIQPMSIAKLGDRVLRLDQERIPKHPEEEKGAREKLAEDKLEKDWRAAVATKMIQMPHCSSKSC